MDIEIITTEALSTGARNAALALCEAAYGEDMTEYWTDIGPGVHALGRVQGELVSHAMWVERTLEPAGGTPLRAAYVELVATHPRVQGQGHASRLLRHLATQWDGFALGALSPSDPAFYARLGWTLWRGPLGVRTSTGVHPTPDEQIMILWLPETPPALDLDAALSVEWRLGEIW